MPTPIERRVRPELRRRLEQNGQSAGELRHDSTWREAGEASGFSSEVCLIRIAGVRSETGQPDVGDTCQPQEPLEAQDTIERLRSVAERLTTETATPASASSRGHSSVGAANSAAGRATAQTANGASPW